MLPLILLEHFCFSIFLWWVQITNLCYFLAFDFMTSAVAPIHLWKDPKPLWSCHWGGQVQRLRGDLSRSSFIFSLEIVPCADDSSLLTFNSIWLFPKLTFRFLQACLKFCHKLVSPIALSISVKGLVLLYCKLLEGEDTLARETWLWS